MVARPMQSQLDSTNAIKCLLATEVVRTFGSLSIPVIGWSMLPSLRTGDILQIKYVESEFINAGDIVVFMHGDALFAHRVISRMNRLGADRLEDDFRFTTQGDSLPEPDAPISSLQLLGKVRLITRGNRRFQPRSTLSLPKRMMAAILRRSFLASRVLARLHTVRQVSQKQVDACQP
jgi:signal peptidase I